MTDASLASAMTLHQRKVCKFGKINFASFEAAVVGETVQNAAGRQAAARVSPLSAKNVGGHGNLTHQCQGCKE